MIMWQKKNVSLIIPGSSSLKTFFNIATAGDVSAPRQYTSEYIHNTTDVNMSAAQNRKTNWIVCRLYANYIRRNVDIIILLN